VALAGAVVLLFRPAPAQAGMPSVTLTDVARLRLDAISFFLAGFLLSSWGLQLLWNRLGRDFPALPRLGYGRAVGLVTLWGLLFVLVLTMISGARELLTPGAWQKQGWTYRLSQDTAPAPTADRQEQARREKLQELRFALWEYARTHGGQFPPPTAASEIPAERWQLPGPSGMRYVYAGAGRGTRPLAYEPEVFGPERFVLFSNGDIKLLRSDEIERALQAEGPP
jgi:hypothetical protein